MWKHLTFMLARSLQGTINRSAILRYDYKKTAFRNCYNQILQVLL